MSKAAGEAAIASNEDSNARPGETASPSLLEVQVATGTHSLPLVPFPLPASVERSIDLVASEFLDTSVRGSVVSDVKQLLPTHVSGTAANLVVFSASSRWVNQALVVPTLLSKRSFTYATTYDGNVLRIEPKPFLRDGTFDVDAFLELVAEASQAGDRNGFLATGHEMASLAAGELPHRHADSRIIGYANWQHLAVVGETDPQRRAALQRFLQAIAKRVIGPLFDSIACAEHELAMRFVPEHVRDAAPASLARERSADRLQLMRNRLQAVEEFPVLGILLPTCPTDVLKSASPSERARQSEHVWSGDHEGLLSAIDEGRSVTSALCRFVGFDAWMVRVLRHKERADLAGYGYHRSHPAFLARDLDLFPPQAAPRTTEELKALYMLMRERKRLPSFFEMLKSRLHGTDVAALWRLMRDRQLVIALDDYERFLNETREWICQRLPGMSIGDLPTLLGTRSVSDWVALCERWHRVHGQLDRMLDERNARADDRTWAVPFPDFSFAGFKFHPLKSTRALADEGRAMSHCVATYAGRCASGRSAVLSMRLKRVRVATIELSLANAGHGRLQFSLEQAVGPENDHLAKDHQDVVNRLVVQANRSHIPLLAFTPPEPENAICGTPFLGDLDEDEENREIPVTIAALGPAALDLYRPCLEPAPGLGTFYPLLLRASEVGRA